MTTSWHESKTFIASTVGVGTAVFLITVFFTAVIPTWTWKLRNENEMLRQELAKQGSIRERGKELERGNEILREKNNILKAQIQVYQRQDVFADSDPYPLGFRQIRLGDPVENLRSVWEPTKLEWSDDYVSMSIDHPLFGRVMYNFVIVDQDTIITSLAFLYRNIDEDTYLFLREQAALRFTDATPMHSIRNNQRKTRYHSIRGISLNLEEYSLYLHEEIGTRLGRIFPLLDTNKIKIIDERH